MSDSDFGGSDGPSKKHHRKKSKRADDKPKKRKRSKSFERDGLEKSKREKMKQTSENDFGDNEEREYKSNDKKHRKQTSFTPGEKSRDRKRKGSPLEDEPEYEKESGRNKRNVSKTEESIKNKIDKSKSKNRIEDTKERRKDMYEENERKSNLKCEDYEDKRHKKSSSRIEECAEDVRKKKISSKYEEHNEERHNKTSSYRFEKSRDIDENKPHSHRYEMTDENNCDERKRDKNCGDNEDKIRSNYEKPQRYWSNSRPMRENCDSYWNKYNDRFKESTENMKVGPRYYSSGEKPKQERKSREEEKDKQGGIVDEVNRDNQTNVESGEKSAVPKRTKTLDLLTSRTGGAYIPPAKLKMMQESITDKGSAAYQRLAWEALKKSIQGHVNKINVSNISGVLKALQKENIVRGKGLLCRALIQAQAASPTFTNVYASLAAVINARFPMIGELLLKRLVVQFRRGFKRNDKTICITAATFIAHLVNQEVAHEILALEILTLLIETPTDDSVEVAIAFLKECGMKLSEVASKGIMGIFDMLRNILHEGKLEKRVQYMIEVMFQIRKEDFKAHPALITDLDLVDQDDKIIHLISLEDNHDPQDILNVFKFEPDYEANEAKYKSIVQDSDEEGSDGDSSGSGDSDDESDEEVDGEEKQGVIVDKTETNLVALRKTIYLTIQSSLDFEECAHKLLKMELKPGQEIEMAHMFLDCCAEQRTYEKFFGLLSQRFCQINRSYIGPFEETFRDSYATIHRMSNDKLRNIAKLFAHLLYTDAISWDVLATIRLNEDDTTSSSRIFIKILFQELSEYMGLAKLNQRVKDPGLQSALEGLFPRDNPKHTRFAINFFTSIGLGGITDELREHLKSMPKPTLAVPQLVQDLTSSGSSDSSSSDSSSDSSDSSDSSSDSSSSSGSSSSNSENSSRKKKKNRNPLKKKRKEPSSRKVGRTNTTSNKTSSQQKKRRDR